LLDKGIISARELEWFEAEAKETVEEAVRFAEESPWPEPEEALQDLYA
jgi:TPP-dependent pyruvate/acetoin dehydrogenase alpha subunit